MSGHQISTNRNAEALTVTLAFVVKLRQIHASHVDRRSAPALRLNSTANAELSASGQEVRDLKRQLSTAENGKVWISGVCALADRMPL